MKKVSIDITRKRLIEEIALLRKRVSQLEEMEKAARQAGELLHIFRINSPVCLFVLQDGKFVFANKQFQKLLGIDMEELTDSYSLDLVHSEDRETVRKNAIAMLKGKLSRPYVYRIISRDKRVRWLEEGVVSVQYQGKRAVLGHSVDITDRIKAEADLRRHYEREKRLRRKLEKEVNKRIEFTRALVHELKTPLTSILFSSELLVDELRNQPWASIAQNINRGASNLNSRIDELLDLARFEVGGLQITPTVLNAEVVIRGVAANMSALFDRYHQHLVVDVPDGLPPIRADGVRLQQVIMNLLVNASKFTPEGGTITVSCRMEGDNLVVKVKDTGVGISRREQRKIFEPYYRRRSDRERLSGLGLGLSLSKRLVELHGGKIWAESQAGKGSTFTFTIPREPPEGVVTKGEEVKPR